jgi:hypothetical protein
MKKRIDGIYKCSHQKPFIINNKVMCSDCPYEPTLKTIAVGGLIELSTMKLSPGIVVDMDNSSIQLVTVVL